MWYLWKEEGGKNVVAKAQVISALTPWLGSELSLALDDRIEEITRLLNLWSPRADLEALASRIDSLLFLAVRQATQGRMLIHLPDGGWVRVLLEDFSAMADDALYPLFSSFPPDPQYLLILRDYAMHHESFSALKAQYLLFSALQSREELAAIAAFVKKRYPAYRWRAWLEE